MKLTEGFNLLATAPDGIKRLRELILSLAVQGKLVPPACRQAGKTLDTLPQAKNGRWFVYVLECENGSFYKGFTTDLSRRYAQHCAGTAADWTKKHPPKQLFYWEQCHSEKEALSREHYLKSGSGREWFKHEVVEKPEAWQPASELLKQIRAEKDRLIAEGKIKKDKPLPAIGDEEKPFELPEGWEWIRFGSVINSSEAGWSPSCDGVARTGDAWGVLKVSAVSWGEFRSNENKALPVELAARTEIEVKAGDFLLSRANTEELVARSVVVNNPEPKLMMSDKIIRLDLSSLVNRHFFNQVNNTANSRAHYIEHASGTSSSMKNVSREVIMNLPVPLPPLAEQSRIVAKVEELMALCDALETRGKLEAEQHARLTATLFDALAASESAHQLQENWARLASNFDLVLDRPAAVDALEQTLLQLAVRGLLVEQNPNDQPASELLKQIRAEKDRLIAEGKIKKDKPLPAINDDEKPFDLPLGWEWVRFGSVINSSEAGWSPSCDGAPRTGDTWGVLKVSAVSWGEFRSYENKALPMELAARTEIEVKAGDFLLSRANTEELVARSVVANNPEPKLMMSDKIIRLDLSSLVNRHFFNLVNNTANSRAHYIGHASGTSSSMKNVSREVIMNLPVPVPPLAEQSRIVARVEALRALCAQLRERLVSSQKSLTHLAETLVEQAA